ncbi:MAG: SIS domain-containing protein [Patescibacteria group bacterium]|nr:SIS domain-containing protein [Patescibacteria group bacterium]MCL5431565.1 SIS domain-containing protein [Patescibacteria group bacterium]
MKDYIANLKIYLDKINLAKLESAAKLLAGTYQKRSTVFVVGNGGSAATASHIACDLAKTVRGHKGDSPWLSFKVITLTDNVPLITAWSNDVGYESAYSGQLEALGEKGDLLIAISSSGNSQNILNCVKAARKMGIKTIGISGFGGGKLKKICDLSLTTDAAAYGPVEDIQLIINHMLTDYFLKTLSQGKLKVNTP